METSKKINALMEIGIKTAIGFLPSPFASAFTAIVDNVKESVLTKRANDWQKEVITRLEKLETDYDELINNQSFATALIKTSELAIKTEFDEKRKLLANALINSFSRNIEEDKIIIFLHLIEKYTVLHINLIKYIHDEYKTILLPNNLRPTFYVEFQLAFSEIDKSYLKKAINDLKNDYLIEDIRLDGQSTIWLQKADIITQLGNEFYDFLKDS